MIKYTSQYPGFVGRLLFDCVDIVRYLFRNRVFGISRRGTSLSDK